MVDSRLFALHGVRDWLVRGGWDFLEDCYFCYFIQDFDITSNSCPSPSNECQELENLRVWMIWDSKCSKVAEALWILTNICLPKQLQSWDVEIMHVTKEFYCWNVLISVHPLKSSKIFRKFEKKSKREMMFFKFLLQCLSSRIWMEVQT